MILQSAPCHTRPITEKAEPNAHIKGASLQLKCVCGSSQYLLLGSPCRQCERPPMATPLEKH
eukprot:154077-Prorocentrum_lima.AAC.1